MWPFAFALPLAQTFVTPPSPEGGLLPFALFGLVLLVVLVILLRRRGKARRPRQAVLIDGSNVMHWQENAPSLNPLRDLVRDLTRVGLTPGVVFDATAGYKLSGQYLGERELARLLHLPAEQIFVVPKGSQADGYLLETARNLQAQIVSNDRFRDWAGEYPEVDEPGRFIRGGVQDGRVWLEGLNEAGVPKVPTG
jgi:hypothetical protein